MRLSLTRKRSMSVATGAVAMPVLSVGQLFQVSTVRRRSPTLRSTSK
jgi:hypothetical protein